MWTAPTTTTTVLAPEPGDRREAAMTATVRPQGHRVPVQAHHRGVEVIPPPTEVPGVLVEPSPVVGPAGHAGPPPGAPVPGPHERRPHSTADRQSVVYGTGVSRRVTHG